LCVTNNRQYFGSSNAHSFRLQPDWSWHDVEQQQLIHTHGMAAMPSPVAQS